MGLGTSPTISLSDRIRREHSVLLAVENLGPEVGVRLELLHRPGPEAIPPIAKEVRLASGKAVKLTLDANELPLPFDKSGQTPIRGRVTADKQPAVLMVRMQRADRLRRTSIVVAWAQLVAMGPPAEGQIPSPPPPPRSDTAPT